ncbi:phenylacetyl-CoA ligase [Gymnopus androsaceus JB14]|uniref:Phenylacetyl-CoA ligase n=1 Tax=Gymnopus androsaceus JB14 TaxID=1447944 RepID=A0A6A4HQZ6_9AGAR|nr:phenylacetyl-CoA ligase [Gymnopus androsaceus JB14]
MEFSTATSLPSFPDDITIGQFMLEPHRFPLTPVRPDNVPWLVEDASGRGLRTEQVRQRTANLANALHTKYNIGEGDVVCIFSPNHVDYPISIWAVHTLGGIVTPANPSYTAEELVHQLEISQARLIIAYSEFLPIAFIAAQKANIPLNRVVVIPSTNDAAVANTITLDELVSSGATTPRTFSECRLKPGEAKTKVAFLSFSSGTTGKPKAVAIPHYSIISNVVQMSVHWNVIGSSTGVPSAMTIGDVCLGVLPFFHIYGLIVTVHFTLFCGMTLVVVPKFSFLDYLKSIVRHKVTHLYVVPPQVVLLCKHPAVSDYDMKKHVKFVLSGAAPLSGELVQQVTKVFPNAHVGQGYGLTETATTVSMFPPNQKIGTIGSSGVLIPGIIARVRKADGSLANEGEQGELVVRGPSMALGYFNNEQATKETFIDGWVHTGDEVIIKNGEVFVVDRLKEIMKVRGFQVAPAELEGHLLLHPAVADVCVVGIPDEYSGELPLAYVVVDSKLLPTIAKDPSAGVKLKQEIAKHVSDAKIQYKWLKGGVEFIDAIPKNPSGKILRRILRDEARKLRKPNVSVIQAKL